MSRKKYYLVIVRPNGREVWSNWSYYEWPDEDIDWFVHAYGPGEVKQVVEGSA